jgi:IS5 family transposase
MNDEDRKTQREDEKPKHKIRAKVEHRFADLKVQMKGGTTRFIGLVRNNMNFTISCIAANLRLIAYRQMKLRKSVSK